MVKESDPVESPCPPIAQSRLDMPSAPKQVLTCCVHAGVCALGDTCLPSAMGAVISSRTGDTLHPYIIVNGRCGSRVEDTSAHLS
jgi:hypothetical protein